MYDFSKSTRWALWLFIAPQSRPDLHRHLESRIIGADLHQREAATAAFHLPQPSACVSPDHLSLLGGCLSRRRPHRSFHRSKLFGVWAATLLRICIPLQSLQFLWSRLPTFLPTLLRALGSFRDLQWYLILLFVALLQLIGRSAADIVREDTDREMATFLMSPHCTSRSLRPIAFLWS